jgi:predicted acylesterase/phospholipase RssA
MPALNMTVAIPRLFRTYHASKNQSYDCMIWEAARATTAAPTFFKRIVIGGAGSAEPFVDGGMGCNNPAAIVLQEAAAAFPGRHVSCLVSIGAGHAQTISIPKPGLLHWVLPLEVVNAMKRIATDCERTAHEVAKRFQETKDVYFRFNVEQGLQDVGLAHWERLDEVTTHTKQYMLSVDTEKQLSSAVAAIQAKEQAFTTEQMSELFRRGLNYTKVPHRWDIAAEFCQTTNVSLSTPNKHFYWKRGCA